ncbi:MAG: hypothetical protein IJU45_00850 [Clostridia bacterium]|nr:hypothetical protein [Clostridia bacterium]
MLVYSIIMFAVAVLFLAVGISIHNGNSHLINEYHQSNVQESELKNYCKAFSKGMFAICLTLIVSGVISLFGYAKISVAVLSAGLLVSIVIIIKVQKKYNGGFFG